MFAALLILSIYVCEGSLLRTEQSNGTASGWLLSVPQYGPRGSVIIFKTVGLRRTGITFGTNMPIMLQCECACAQRGVWARVVPCCSVLFRVLAAVTANVPILEFQENASGASAVATCGQTGNAKLLGTMLTALNRAVTYGQRPLPPAVRQPQNEFPNSGRLNADEELTLI
jgi:hypothetical protein